MNAAVAKLRELEAPAEAHSLMRLAGLIERLELKEGYEGEHTARVSALAVAIAAELGLSGADCRRIELGALLHDVGKLRVPDRVLTKRGHLDESEWATIRSHAALGERLLIHVLDLPEVLAIVRSHHERWDGHGYPDGSEGEDIPLAARVVAVADAFQAMTEPRPYRKPRTRAAALREIVSQAGRQFDPACVEALRAAV
ncbi:MAG: HD domain-containing protein [Actinobacteria bacterium]|nr:HD domain-containing protein [Actinomycetota bacterium]